MTRPSWKHVIGILGSLGPHAHIEFESLLLDATGKALGRPPLDQDYPSWVVSSMPGVPDRTRALLEGSESPVDAMVKSASRLSEAAFAVIPCNSAHAFFNEVRRRAQIPFLDMIRVTAERAVERVGPRGGIGILAASGTLRAELYQKEIHALSPETRVVSPLSLPNGDELQERLVMEPIFGPLRNGGRLGGGIKSGAFRDPGKREELAEPMREAARKLAAAGAEVVLTACTEIPLVLG
ncbi:MAG: aspartate/glutamate racemase family protein, partial [Vicinamibacteria bacterium]